MEIWNKMCVGVFFLNTVYIIDDKNINLQIKNIKNMFFSLL